MPAIHGFCTGEANIFFLGLFGILGGTGDFLFWYSLRAFDDEDLLLSSKKGGKLLLDRSQKLLAILPDEDSTFRTATIMGSPQANSIPLLGDETVSVKLTTAVYQSDSSEPTSYEKIWTGLRTGANLVLCYNGSGKLDYLYLRSSSDAVNEDNVLVAKNKPNGATNPFASLVTGSGDYQIYKNGVPAAVSDLQQYDVATYDGGSNTLFVSDLKLTGIYEDVYPNTAAPSTITVLGTPFQGWC